VTRSPLSSVDAADRAQLLKLLAWLVPTTFVLFTAGEAMAFQQGRIGAGLLVVLILLNLPVSLLLGLGLFRLMEGSARGLAGMVYAGGGITPDPAHSALESLEARGFYPEAAAAYRQHLVEHPADNLARFKLARLCHESLNDPAAAERLYLEIRQHQPTPRDEMLAANLLIEFYRKTGRTDRVKVELARFADRWKGSKAGEQARRQLRELKQGDDVTPGA